MTISSLVVKNSYNGDGSATQFEYQFPIHSTAELKVIVRAANGTETVKSLGSDYSVVDNGSSGGTVTFGSAPASGVSVILLRDTNLTQETDYIANDPFPAETHEAALDKLTLQIQEAQEEIDRSIKLSRTNTMTSTEFTNSATDRAGKILAFDTTGELSVAQELGNNKGNWSASTAYAVRDIVKDTSTNNIFMCKTAHTSSGVQPLTTNADSAKWDLLVDAAAATNSAAAAAASETAAAASETAAANSANTANTHKNTAETHKNDAQTAKTAAETAKTAAETAQAAAETALDTFDDRFLGAKSSDPTVDNDGNALIDGALFFSTTDDVMKVYDLTNTQWRQLALTGTNQTNVNTVAGQISPTNNIAAVAGANANITAVAGQITPTNNIATLAGISGLSSLASAEASGHVTNVSNNLAGVNSFAERYRVSAGVPTTSLDIGDLAFDTNAGELKVYKSSGWANAGSSVNGTSARFRYIATANQTVFTGNDVNSVSMNFDSGFADVYLNGVKLVSGAGNDYTEDGTTVTLATGASAGDILEVVGFGTFNVAAINAANITSGTVSDNRLPTTMAGKTLTTANVTGTINADALTARGDGSSADGFITLNCSQNSHGVKIQSPAHSAGQSYTLILPTSVGSSGQVLATNGASSNQLSWIDATETKPTVADVSQTIAPATATTINITGTNFVSIPQVEFVKTDGSVTVANSVSFTSATSLSVNCTLALGNYYVRIENPDGNAGRSTNNIITASTAPSFSTAAGSLGTFAGNFSGNLATIAGSSDSAVTFSEVGSNLATANVTLSSAGVLATTDFGGSSTSPTLYNFTVQISDAENQTATRAFSLQSSFGATGGGQFN